MRDNVRFARRTSPRQRDLELNSQSLRGVVALSVEALGEVTKPQLDLENGSYDDGVWREVPAKRTRKSTQAFNSRFVWPPACVDFYRL